MSPRIAPRIHNAHHAIPSASNAWEAGIPGDVRTAAGMSNGNGAAFGDQAIGFTMRRGGQKVDLVWDRATDTLFMKDNKGSYRAVDDTLKDAVVARLSQAELRHTRSGSTYNQLRDDVVEFGRSRAAARQKPAQPKASEQQLQRAVDDLYTDRAPPRILPVPIDVSQVKERQEPQKSDKPVQTERAEQNEKPAEAPKMSEADFLARYGQRTVTTEELRKNGIDARLMDTNGDGAISGNEWKGMFRLVDRADSNKDAKSINPDDAKVKEKLSALDNSKDGVAPYGRKERDSVEQTLQAGNVMSFRELSAEECRQKGLSPGTMVAYLDHPMFEKGGGLVGVAVYYDPKQKALFKEYMNNRDGKDTPVVRLTRAEHEMLLNRTDVNLADEPKTPSADFAFRQIFGSDFD